MSFKMLLPREAEKKAMTNMNIYVVFLFLKNCCCWRLAVYFLRKRTLSTAEWSSMYCYFSSHTAILLCQSFKHSWKPKKQVVLTATQTYNYQDFPTSLTVFHFLLNSWTMNGFNDSGHAAPSTTVLENKSHSADILNQLNQLRIGEQFTDAVVIVDQEELKCHR